MDKIMTKVRLSIPTLNKCHHKGNMGRICVVGGSKEYTGAPYFAGISALYCGADLVHILCSNSAAPAIKCYSPELIVHPILDNNLQESLAWLPKMHSLVIGPGLGMSENIPNTTEIIKTCHSAKKPIVVDADGIYVVAKCKNVILGYKQAILTPNVNEFNRLYTSILGQTPNGDLIETSKLATALGNVTIIRKGLIDIISDGNTTIECDAEGSPRRCGGQGDLLSGVAAVFSNWLHQSDFNDPCSPTVAASVAACILTRKCANLAFNRYRRSTVTMKMIDEIQIAFEEIFS